MNTADAIYLIIVLAVVIYAAVTLPRRRKTPPADTFVQEPPMTDPQRIQALDRAAVRIGEVCPNAQILASWQLPDGSTQGYAVGMGDWYARQALAQSFIDGDKARTNSAALSKTLHREADDE